MVKIATSSELQLRLISKASLGIVIVFWILASGWLIVFCQSTIIYGHRQTDGSLDFQIERHLFGVKLSSRKVSGINGAEVEANPREEDHHSRHRHRRGDAPNRVLVRYDDTSRIVFDGPNGKIPLTKSYSSGSEEHQRIAEAINTFISNAQPPRATFVLSPGIWWWVGGAFLVFLAVGTIFSKEECLLDKESGFLILKSSAPLSKPVSYPFGDVKCFFIAQRIDHDDHTTNEDYGQNSSHSRGLLKTLAIRLSNGDEIPIFSGWSSFGLEKLRTIVGVLEGFRKSAAPE